MIQCVKNELDTATSSVMWYEPGSGDIASSDLLTIPYSKDNSEEGWLALSDWKSRAKITSP